MLTAWSPTSSSPAITVLGLRTWPKVVLGSLTLKCVPPTKPTSHLGEGIFGKPAICSTKAGVVLSAEDATIKVGILIALKPVSPNNNDVVGFMAIALLILASRNR